MFCKAVTVVIGDDETAVRDVNPLNVTTVIRMYTKIIGHCSASDQCYNQSVHTNQKKKTVELKQLVYVFLCKMLYLFNNKITPVLYNQKVFSPLIVISNCLCFTCAADTNLQWVET